jgi:N-acyl homoserine lactone hydrolase
MLSPASRSPDLAIDVQLGKAGFKPSDINYVILGHMHLDHAGNVGKFPGATIVYQRDEIVNAFWPKPGYAGPYITADFAMLRNDVGANAPNRQKVIELNGDLDLFGDGSIYIHRAVSHTPGSQMVVVRLPKTGPVVVTSDVCYLMDNLQKDMLPTVSLAYDPAGMLDAYAWIKHLMSAEGADVIFAHDEEVFKKHKHAPEFYE